MPRPHRTSTAAPALTRVLQREWERLRTDDTALAHATRWHITNFELSDLNQLMRAIGSHTDEPQAEARLTNLVHLARSDQLAARVVLQRLLAGILATATRRCRSGAAGNETLNEVIDELVAAVWIEVRTFRPSRRPACLAAALIRDAEARVFGPSRRAQPVELRSPDNIADLEYDTAPAPIVELAAIVRGSTLDTADRELLRQLLVDGVRGAARYYGVTTRMVRYRRRRLAERLRTQV